MLVIGIGNRWRRDDGAGLAVVARLRRELCVTTDIIGSNDVLSLIERWAGQDLVVVVDAVQSGAAAGTVHRVDATAKPLPACWTFASSHEIGLANAVEISRAFGRLPQRLVIVGIEGEDFDFGTGFSAAVSGAIPAAVSAVVSCLPAHAA